MVSTKVGGIPEVLPESMLILSEPSVDSLIEGIEVAIKRHENGANLDPFELHEKVKNMYNWRNVAERTKIVYDKYLANSKSLTKIEQIQK